MKYIDRSISFIMCFRLDSMSRFENLKEVLKLLTYRKNNKIFIIESGTYNKSILKNLLTSVDCTIKFLADNDKVLHRTKHINTLANLISTDFIAVWDCDVLVSISQIEKSLNILSLNEADFVFPYDGNFLNTTLELRREYIETNDYNLLFNNYATLEAPYTNHACGGGFIARRETYIECGMENENFYGWGQEDGERVKRWQILGKRVTRVPGPMFHLYHPRGLNSGYLSAAHREKMIGEYNRIAGMLAAALRQEIRTWPHMQRHLSKLPE